MPTLAVVDGIRICMYYADHAPAHFHAISGEHEIIVDLANLSVIDGTAPSRIVRRVRAWAARHRKWIGAMLGSVSKRSEARKNRGMMQSIIAVRPLPQTRLRITWADQSESVLDLRPLLARSGVFEVLADQARFDAVQIGERGRTLIWRDDEGDEIDLCADALWHIAHGKVSAA